jgi:GntR family transcriptional regulator
MPREAVDKPSGARLGRGELGVDRTAEVPVGVQLGWALRARIASGEHAPGERLPGLREMAEMSGLNVNTVRAVYQRLEQEGLIDSQQGSGTFVTGAPRSSPACSIVERAARAAIANGIDPREVAAALYVSPGSAEQPIQHPDAVRRRALREQIAALERTLGEMEAAHPGLAPQPAGTQTGTTPSLPGAMDLERIRTQLVRQLTVLQARIDEDGPSDAREATPARQRQRAARQPAPGKPLEASRQEAAPGKRESTPRPRPRPAAAGA